MLSILVRVKGYFSSLTVGYAPLASGVDFFSSICVWLKMERKISWMSMARPNDSH